MLAVALRSGARGVHQPPPPRHPAGLFRGVGLKRFAAHVMSDKKGQAHAATTDEEAASASRAPERPQRDAGGGASTSSASGSGAPLAAAAAATAPVVADSRSTKLTVAGWELEGVSIGGQETCIIVPRAKVAFDIGRCPQRAAFQQTLLISHGHLDHVGGLPFHVSTRALNCLPPSKVVIPPHYEPTLRRLLDINAQLESTAGDDAPPLPPPPCELLPLPPGGELLLPSGLVARPFATHHTLPSQGYILSSRRKRLRADLAGRSQEEIRSLRLAGHDVNEVQEVAEIAFTADTTADLFDSPAAPPELYTAKLLIVEMTFLDDAVAPDQAKMRGHMHLDSFALHADKFRNEVILLIHFSPRYSRAQILEHLDAGLPPALKARCVPFLNGFA